MNDYERDPFKGLVLIFSVAYPPFAFFRFDTLAGGVLHSFPHPFGQVFLAVWFLSSGMALYGVVRQYSIQGVLWERAGLYGVAVLFLTYGVWAWGAFGGIATGFASLLTALGIAAIQRIRQINRRVKKAVKAHGPS